MYIFFMTSPWAETLPLPISHVAGSMPYQDSKFPITWLTSATSIMRISSTVDGAVSELLSYLPRSLGQGEK